MRLPTGRAVVGGLLIAVSVLGVMATHSAASAPPHTRFVVAAQDIAPGTIIGDESEVASLFGELAVDLAEPMTERALQLDDLHASLPFATVGPLEPGDLLSRTLMVDVDAEQRHQMTLALPSTRALAGRLKTGEHINVLATYARAGDAYTVVVAERVTVVAVADTSADGFGAGEVALTIAADDPTHIQAIGHASAVATVFLSRPSRDPASDLGVGAMFRPDDFYMYHGDGPPLEARPAPSLSGDHRDRASQPFGQPMSDAPLPLPGMGGVVGGTPSGGETDG